MQTLRELRESKGVRKDYVQEQLGVSWPTYNKYESDPENTMTLAQINKVLELFGEEPIHIFLASNTN